MSCGRLNSGLRSQLLIAKTNMSKHNNGWKISAALVYKPLSKNPRRVFQEFCFPSGQVANRYSLRFNWRRASAFTQNPPMFHKKRFSRRTEEKKLSELNGRKFGTESKFCFRILCFPCAISLILRLYASAVKFKSRRWLNWTSTSAEVFIQYDIPWNLFSRKRFSWTKNNSWCSFLRSKLLKIGVQIPWRLCLPFLRKFSDNMYKRSCERR